MRVIGGRSRGRRLAAKLPRSVRPTSDRVRESIFDILGSQGGVEGLTSSTSSAGAAPSGSRRCPGAPRRPPSSTSTPTPSPRCARTSTPSASTTETVTLVRAALPGWLQVARADHAFDLALCDPPYDFDGWPAAPRRARAGLVVMESSSPIALPDAWVVARERRYGGTLVTVAHQRSRGQALVKVGLFPGSFDPFHNGHLEIVERATKLFDEVVVAALRNPQKGAAALRPRGAPGDARGGHGAHPEVRIVSMSTLIVYVARDVGATAIVRGLRAVSDFEAEMQMAQMNNHLSGVETIFIPTSPRVVLRGLQARAGGLALRRRRLGLRARARGRGAARPSTRRGDGLRGRWSTGERPLPRRRRGAAGRRGRDRVDPPPAARPDPRRQVHAAVLVGHGVARGGHLARPVGSSACPTSCARRAGSCASARSSWPSAAARPRR